MTYSFTDEEMTRLREAMDRAPSIFNQRPWDLRRVAGDRVNLYSTPVEDLGRLLPREVVISCGAALYNLRLAIEVAGRKPSVWLLPGLSPGSGLLTTVASEETLLASIEVMQGRPNPPSTADQELYEALWLRRTYRGPYQYVPVPPPILVEMEIAAARERCWLRVLPKSQCRQALRAVASANKKISQEKRLAERLYKLNLVQPAEFGPTPAGKSGEKAPVTRPDFWRPGEYAWFEDRLRTPPVARRRPQLMALSTDDDRPLDWLRAGEAMQHGLLNGTRFSMSVMGGRSTPYREQLYYAPLDPHRLWRRPPVPNGYAVEASFLTQSLELANLRDLDQAKLAALGLVGLHVSQSGTDRWRWPWHSYFTEIPQVLLRVGYAEVNRVTGPGTESVLRYPHDAAYVVPVPRGPSDAVSTEPIPRHPYDDLDTESPPWHEEDED